MDKYGIGGIPIIDAQQHLIGILTNGDLRFETNMNRLIVEIMNKDKLVTAPKGTKLENAKNILQHYKVEKLPVVDDHNKLIGLITYKDIMRLEDYPLSCKDTLGILVVGAAVGVNAELHDRVDALIHVGVDVVCIDTAHGHSKGVLDAIKSIRERHKNLEIIGGNVATAEGAKALVDAGVSGVKVGVGPGSICTTRVVAGVGVPQLSAIMHSAAGIKKTGVPIIGDGGSRFTGDIVKALAAGAACIMAGGLFAGVEEAPGETILYEGRKFKTYRGMGSLGAMQLGSKDRYFQDADVNYLKFASTFNQEFPGFETDIHGLVAEEVDGKPTYFVDCVRG